MTVSVWLLLVALGFGTGAYASLVGVGGGFILVPVLLMFYPAEDPEVITSISLAVIFVNALSASWAYARMKRIDYRSGIPFAIATIPGAILGALTTTLVPRHLFELVFGLFMVSVALFLFLKPVGGGDENADDALTAADAAPQDTGRKCGPVPCASMPGIGASLLVGFLSSFLGIGGGILHVPVMIYMLDFAVHIATATSQFILIITSFTGALTHLVAGGLAEGWMQVIPLAIGVLFGAQVGAQLSRRLHGAWIVRGLSLALGVAGVRFVLAALG